MIDLWFVVSIKLPSNPVLKSPTILFHHSDTVKLH